MEHSSPVERSLNGIGLTVLDRELLNPIAAKADWITRSELAHALGRPSGRLHPYDIGRLKRMAEADIIKVERRQIAGFKTEYVYLMADSPINS